MIWAGVRYCRRKTIDWSDKPLLIVGCGASLKGFDLNRLRGLGRILAVKEAIWDLPFAHACFGLDVPWMERQRTKLSELPMPLYLAVPPNRAFPIMANATYYMRKFSDRLSDNAAEISCGRNSGFGAINLAYHKLRGGVESRHAGRPLNGADIRPYGNMVVRTGKPEGRGGYKNPLARVAPGSRKPLIILFGYDYQPNSYYCPQRYTHKKKESGDHWPSWARIIDGIADQLADVEVLNASPNSTIRAFKKIGLDQATEHLGWIRSQRGCGV